MITYSLWTTRSAPTETFVQSYEKALEDFGGILADLEQIDGHIQDIEEQMETQGAPYTPGRIPGR